MALPLRRLDDPTMEWVNVTPKLAAKWLESNEGNRHVRQRDVQKYARDMLAGAWDRTAEPIKFSPTGRLLDGQHRLLAIIEAGVTARLAVAYNVPDTAQARMDTGSTRTAADALAMLGVPNYALTAAVARLALAVAYDSVGRFDATHDDVIAWVEDHPEAARSVTFALPLRNQLAVAPRIVGYTHLVLSHVDEEAADSFWLSAAERLAAYPGDPAIALARRFDDARVNKERIPDAGYLSLIYRAWNYRRAQKPLRQLKLNSAAGGLIPIPQPK